MPTLHSTLYDDLGIILWLYANKNYATRERTEHMFNRQPTQYILFSLSLERNGAPYRTRLGLHWRSKQRRVTALPVTKRNNEEDHRITHMRD